MVGGEGLEKCLRIKAAVGAFSRESVKIVSNYRGSRGMKGLRSPGGGGRDQPSMGWSS